MARNFESYSDEQKVKNNDRLKKICATLPPFVDEFFRGEALTHLSSTLVAYAYDIRTFLNYLVEMHPNFENKSVKEITLDDLDKLKIVDFEDFFEYLNNYTKLQEGKQISYNNRERGKERKLATLKMLYAHFFKKERLTSNKIELISGPRIHQKTITRLEGNEIARLLKEVESGSKLTDTQKKYHSYTKKRDVALITLLLGTGIRVSECVGINLMDIDFESNAVKVTRKGGNETILYFPDEVKETLLEYYEERKKRITREGSENAFFLSLQDSRITVRSVQLLVKKYTKLVTTIKKITPHKFRSTFGTNLYRATGDIYLVAEVLGHKDVNTTKKHYAQIDDDRKRAAAKFVKLKQ